MVRLTMATWWQRLWHKGCTRVLYMDDQAFQRLLPWLRMQQRRRIREQRRRD